MFTDIVHQQRSNCASVVSACDGAVAFLAGRVPDLGFDGFGIDLNGAGCKFDTDGGFRVQVEFIAGETREQVGFSDAGISD